MSYDFRKWVKERLKKNRRQIILLPSRQICKHLANKYLQSINECNFRSVSNDASHCSSSSSTSSRDTSYVPKQQKEESWGEVREVIKWISWYCKELCVYCCSYFSLEDAERVFFQFVTSGRGCKRGTEIGKIRWMQKVKMYCKYCWDRISLNKITEKNHLNHWSLRRRQCYV